MLTPSVHLGADVSKLTIDLGCSQFAVAASIPNTPAGYRTLIKTLLRRPAPVHVVCEATGPYHRAFVAALHQAGILVSVVNPRLPRDFARARGQLAKTDKIDALMLADYGRTMRPAPTPKPEAQMTLLDDLVTRRAQLVEDRTREKMRLQQTTRAETVASLKLHLRHLDGQIKKLLARIAEVVESTPALRAKVARLVQVQGVATPHRLGPARRPAGTRHVVQKRSHRPRGPRPVQSRQRRLSRHPLHPRRTLRRAHRLVYGRALRLPLQPHPQGRLSAIARRR